MILVQICSLIAYPLVISYRVESSPLSASYLMICSTCLTLKLSSFHHVMNDNRKLLKRLALAGTLDPDNNQSGLPNDVYRVALKYPHNLNFKYFARYLVSPTCCFQLIYPMTDRIRKTFLMKRFLEFVVCNLFIV